MDKQKTYPWEMTSVPQEEQAEIDKYGNGLPMDCVRVGPEGFYLPVGFKQMAADIYNMELRPTDVFVVTFPRSGTTWTQELVWLVANNFDYKKASEVKLTERFPFVEFGMLFNDPKIMNSMESPSKTSEDHSTVNIFTSSITELFRNVPSPYFIKSHLPLCLLPPTLLDTAKVVYVARDPRDVAVSCYHHYRLFKAWGFTGDFKTYWNFFIENRTIYAPFFPHIKEAWEKRNHPNMLFLFYEELSQDLPRAVRRVAQFLGKQVTDEQVNALCQHLHIDNFRQNKSVNSEDLGTKGLFDESKPKTFIGKGKVGGWRDYFDEEMTLQAELWMEENMRDTDLSFPK